MRKIRNKIWYEYPKDNHMLESQKLYHTMDSTHSPLSIPLQWCGSYWYCGQLDEKITGVDSFREIE